MGLSDPFAASALGAAALLLLSLLLWRRRQSGTPRRAAPQDALDTVQAWPPEAARILTIAERRAYDLLRSALPGFLILAQVPLSRFIRVPSRNSHVEWMQRVGSLSAVLLEFELGEVVVAHQVQNLLDLVEIHSSVPGGPCRAGPTHLQTYPSVRRSLVTEVRTSCPSAVTSTSSSIRTPPRPGRYAPGSMVNTIPGSSCTEGASGRGGPMRGSS
jgi:hypothetical protein